MSAATAVQPSPHPLTFDDLKTAVSGGAAAFRCRRRLQPGGGEGDKVFPPTFMGAVYAIEQRRVPGQIGKHTSELQSRENLVCRLLLEKKKNKSKHTHRAPKL